MGPTFAILGAGVFTWLALTSHNLLHWGAAALNIVIIPWTLLFMVETNNRIFEIAELNDKTSTARDNTQLTSLLNKWARLNFIRSFFPFAGGVLGLMAALA